MGSYDIVPENLLFGALSYAHTKYDSESRIWNFAWWEYKSSEVCSVTILLSLGNTAFFHPRYIVKNISRYSMISRYIHDVNKNQLIPASTATECSHKVQSMRLVNKKHNGYNVGRILQQAYLNRTHITEDCRPNPQWCYLIGLWTAVGGIIETTRAPTANKIRCPLLAAKFFGQSRTLYLIANKLPARDLYHWGIGPYRIRCSPWGFPKNVSNHAHFL